MGGTVAMPRSCNKPAVVVVLSVASILLTGNVVVAGSGCEEFQPYKALKGEEGRREKFSHKIKGEDFFMSSSDEVAFDPHSPKDLLNWMSVQVYLYRKRIHSTTSSLERFFPFQRSSMIMFCPSDTAMSVSLDPSLAFTPLKMTTASDCDVISREYEWSGSRDKSGLPKGPGMLKRLQTKKKEESNEEDKMIRQGQIHVARQWSFTYYST